MPWEAFVKTIESWSLKATYPTRTNDPLEFVPQGKNAASEVRAKNTQAYLSYFHSFSTKVTDVAMWGRYGDSSQGVCLAFCFPTGEPVDFQRERENLYKYDVYSCGALFAVRYDENRVEMKYDANNIPNLQSYFNMLTTKAESWMGESEFRFLDKIDDADVISGGNVFFTKYMNFLCGVVLGERCMFGKEYVKALLTNIRRVKTAREKHTANKNYLQIGVPMIPVFGKRKRILLSQICVTQAEVSERKFLIENPIFEDDMTLGQYMKKVPDAKIMEIPDSDGAV